MLFVLLRTLLLLVLSRDWAFYMNGDNLRIFCESLEKLLQYTSCSTATGLELFRTVAVAVFPLWKINCYTALSSFSDLLRKTSYVTNTVSYLNLCSSTGLFLKNIMYLCIESWDVHSCSTSEMYIGARGLSTAMWAASCSWNWISCSHKTSLQVYWVFERFLPFHGDLLPPEPAVVAKSSILLDVKPWDDETDMAKLEECVRSIQADGLVWGSCKYGEVPEQRESTVPWDSVWVVGLAVTACWSLKCR